MTRVSPLGGKRAGAGRPSRYAEKTASTTLMLTPRMRARLNSLAAVHHCSLSDIVEHVLRAVRGPSQFEDMPDA